MNRVVLALSLGAMAVGGCQRQEAAPQRDNADATPRPTTVPAAKPAYHKPLPPLAAGQTYTYGPEGARAVSVADARQQGLLDVDLSDGWSPFIFSERDSDDEASPSKPNRYRQTFLDLAAERIDENGLRPRKGEHNHLEPFGIPPTLAVLLARIEEDLTRDCYAATDKATLTSFTGEVGYVDRDHSRRESETAQRDATWLQQQLAERAAAPQAATTVNPPAAAPLPAGAAADATTALLLADPKLKSRVERTLRGQERIKVIRAAQARLMCEGLLQARARSVPGMYDLATHEALADWERKNDVFGWGILNAESGAGLSRPPLELHFETLQRVLSERVTAAAGILEDGSTSGWKTPPTWKDTDGKEHPVPDLIGDFTRALLLSIHVATPDDMVAFLRSHGPAGLGALHVAFAPPPLPPYYADVMELEAEIDRGDVWYEFPFDAKGKPLPQPRIHFPHLKVSVHWNGQHIPLVWWRTTIGSWRSEMSKSGYVYYRYKNSDVGKRVWRHIVAGPVWIPPDTTPTKDLLTRKVLDRTKGPQTVVNTDVMGPGFQSAYGLVLAIHEQQRGRGFWDNQIRTHGSVDYTSIARRFSHGCHRLVNNRAVRLFDFILRHRPYKRVGGVPILSKRHFSYGGQSYAYKLDTRGYYYELTPPVPVNVLEGNIKGRIKRPITAYMRKHDVDYGDASDPNAQPAPTAAPLPGIGTPETGSTLGP